MSSLSLDQWGAQLLRAARDLHQQIADEEYRRVMEFERAMVLLRLPVGYLPGGLFDGRK